jgi:hypothetical protein
MAWIRIATQGHLALSMHSRLGMPTYPWIAQHPSCLAC